MPPKNLQHRRTHNLLLVSKLLDHRENVSPLTLVIDSLEQSARHFVLENIRRAQIAKASIVYVAYETLRKPTGTNIFIKAWEQTFESVRQTIASHATANPSQQIYIVIDSLNALCDDPATASNIPALLASLIRPNTSMLGVYHADCPITSVTHLAPYRPHPLILLKYLATTIFSTYSLTQILAQKAARDKSLAEPVYGLSQGAHGVLIGHGANCEQGTVLEMEHRRKSGRGVRDWYFLPRRSHMGDLNTLTGQTRLPSKSRETIMLLEDHPAYKKPALDDGLAPSDDGNMDVTFELGLTERQKMDREGVVLPYFDAQKESGGDGGRILYDMGVEDDFDEEEDEI